MGGCHSTIASRNTASPSAEGTQQYGSRIPGRKEDTPPSAVQKPDTVRTSGSSTTPSAPEMSSAVQALAEVDEDYLEELRSPFPFEKLALGL
ncbi:hypothetical protein WJX73_004937 [Symbiochloris irregularis]|uniref:Uncharacterized protein n=1 Tax=Symbiochloris irregularis TaxID=706552 RepID=A0AAW1PBA0_9CHLO